MISTVGRFGFLVLRLTLAESTAQAGISEVRCVVESTLMPR